MTARDARTAPPAGVDAGAAASAGGGNVTLWRGVDQAHMMGLELIVAVLLWGGVGWWVDARLGTGAWFTVLGALIGNAAGIYLVWLRAQRMDGLDVAERASARREHRDAGTTEGHAGVR